MTDEIVNGVNLSEIERQWAAGERTSLVGVIPSLIRAARRPAAPGPQQTDEVQRFDTGSPDECGPGFIPMYRTPDQPVEVPGWEGSIGPSPRQYGQPHVYARDVHSGAGNCVCGAHLGSRRHVQAAPGVPVPEGMRR